MERVKEEIKMHGFYSRKQAEMVGSFVYLTPEGLNVVVTAVSPREQHSLGFDDVEYVGPVTEFVSLGDQDPSSP